MRRMQPQQAAMWGALGATAIEAYDLFVALRTNHRWPGTGAGLSRANAFGIWFASALARIVVGTITAAACASQLAGAFTAFGIGAAGTIVLERILASVKASASAALEPSKLHLNQPPAPPAAEVVGQATDAS
jgi:hypothetical protein